MSRRRRRSIRGRKSSSSSKQSVSPFILQKTSKSNSVCCKDELTEKGETDSLKKENVLSASDEEDEKYDDIPSKEKKIKQDNESNYFQNKRIAKPKDKDKGANIVTSVTFDNSKQPFPKITFEQSCESFLEEITDCTVAITTTNIKCNLSNVKFQIQEVPQPNNLGKKTTFLVQCQQGESTNACFHDKSETRLTLKDEPFEQPQNGVLTSEKKQQQNMLNYKVTLSKTGEEAQEKTNMIPSCSLNQSACRKSCCDNDRDFTLPDITSASWPQWTKSSVCSSFSSDALYDIPPPSEFADRKYNTLDGLTEDIASCHIDASRSPCKRQEGFSPTAPNYIEDSCYAQCLDGTGSPNCSHLFDQLSESDNYEPMFMRPSMSRASYTEDFIQTYAGTNWMRNNSIATVEHNPCSSASYLGKPTKRRRTFPGVSDGHESMQEDLSSYNESMSSGTISPFVLQSFPHHTERLGIPHMLSPFSINSENTLQSSYRPGSRNTNTQLVRKELLDTKYEENPEEIVHRDGRILEHRRGHGHGQVDEMDFIGSWYAVTDQVNTNAREQVWQHEVAESGYEEEMLEAEEHVPEPIVEELAQGDLLIQVIPPSRTTSEEYILKDSPKSNIPSEGDVKVIIKQGLHDLPKYRRGSVMTIILGESDHRCLSTDSKSAVGSSHDKYHKDNAVSEAPSVSPILDMEEEESPNTSEVIDELHPTSTTLSPVISISSLALMHTEDNQAPRSATSSTDQETENQKKTQLDQKDSVEKHSQSSVEGKKHLKPPSDSIHKDPDSGPDHWATRRKLFKESRQWSSAGGSSITSDITEESVSEDNHSMDMTVRDVEDKGFYTETYHSASWIYRGDEPSPTNSAPGLTMPPRPVTIRERTVKICKGMGDYPWGFRIQFSKPIVVTEVDTNGAAEEAGLQVGDYVMAVNGTDVTSVPHSEAADLARQGPELLTLTIGSDIGRIPNTPRPACRGYLHKRTQSGLIKGWRKRWFVLRHDCCLYYYRHKKDEGKRRALSAVRLEGAEVETDTSLGKPFVFKCCPLSASRVYFFCATSSQEMKRWLEAMGRATHPVTQHHVWVDVTRHNANLPPLAVKNPECLGLLHQIDRNKDMCVQHYCILKDGCLYFYNGIRSTHALGGIYLHGYTVREQTLGSKRSTIELKPPSEEFKTFYLCAEDPNENKRWIVALKASIRKWLPLHQAIQDYMNRPPEETRM